VKLRLLVIGRDRKDPLCVAAGAYLDRVGRYHPIELVELKEEPVKGAPVAKVQLAEAERIKKALLPGEHLIVLDERGKQLDSNGVAEKLRRWAMEGPSRVAFAIGGSTGLHPDLVAVAKEKWSLSRMTLPHRMARLFLAEQLYRGCTIVRGEPYHK